MRPFFALAAATTLAGTAALGLASPANAYDSSSYAYAAGHMISRSDIPKVLGDYKKQLAFNGYGPSGKSEVCTIVGVADAPDTDYSFTSGKLQFTAGYNAKAESGPSISVVVNQYADATKAIAAFDEVKTLVKNCAGTVTNTWANPTDGSSSTYTTQLTNGVVPLVTTAGVESIFVDTDFAATSASAPPFLNDQYRVLSLIDTVVISTTFYTQGSANITTKQRKAVDQVAFNAESAWLG